MGFRFVIANLAVLIAGFLPIIHAVGWNYDGSGGELAPVNWTLSYSACGGNAQTPIDINTSTTSPISGSMTFSGYDSSPSTQNYTVTNNGHSVQINVNVKTISLINSRLNGTYVMEQLHFHWGAANNAGSEHSINGQFYPLEIHLVHYNSAKYNNVSQAASANDSSALIVLGVFVNVSETDTSTTLTSITDMLSQVPYLYNRTIIPPFPMKNLLPSLSPCQGSVLYTYSGSLTTPGCTQVVNWNVFAQPIYISSSQLTKFRQVHGNSTSEPLTRNYRPIQPLNGRTVYSYSIQAPGTCNPSTTPAVGGASDVLQNGHRMALLWVAVLSAMNVSL